MRLLLFDMDGVLLQSLGYARALQKTVQLAGESLGFRGELLRLEDIAAFESVQITSEWDSAAACTALLLVKAWQVDPGRRLPEDVFRPAPELPGVGQPGFAEFALQLQGPELDRLVPLERVASLLSRVEQLGDDQHRVLRMLLAEARTPHSLLFRTFQELALGSQLFEQMYGPLLAVKAQYDTESYLYQYDQPMLTPALRADLVKWLSNSERGAAVLTSRPNLPPGNGLGTPEAELGLRLVAGETPLANIPISGWGSLCWLGEQYGCEPQACLKPDPVHALLAMQLALGTSAEEAARRAYDLGKHGLGHPSWMILDKAHVSVFEDTSGGIRSVRAAVEALNRVGVEVTARYHGITTSGVKREALEKWGAEVYPNLEEALRPVLSQPS